MNEAPLLDSFNRRITYLRLSVTDRCDLRCTYCMPQKMTFLPKAEVLSLEELHTLAMGFVERGVDRIRLTGGEPLVRRGIMSLVGSLCAQIGKGLREVTLTTNGTRLSEFAGDLASAGVRRVNVSLDTLDEAIFERLTRRGRLHDVLAGIDAALSAGLQVKINTVALKGINEREIPALIEWAHSRGCDITLIETMPLGEVDEDRTDHYLPLPGVLRQLEDRWALFPSQYKTGGPARYYDISATGGRLGVITPLTENFCAGCNRVRVTATGQLFPCLGGREQVDLRAALRSRNPAEELTQALDTAMHIKPERHHFRIGDGDNEPALARHMSMTGG